MPNFSTRQLSILAAAVEIIAEQGFQALSLDKIAREINIKKSSIYCHFDSKQEILNAILEGYKTKIVGMFEEISATNNSGFDKLKSYFFNVCDVVDKNPYYLRLCLFESEQYSYLSKEEFYSVFLYPQKQLFLYVEEAQNNNEIKAELDKECLISLIRGTVFIILKNKLLSPNYDIKKSCNEHWNLIEKCILQG